MPMILDIGRGVFGSLASVFCLKYNEERKKG